MILRLVRRVESAQYVAAEERHRHLAKRVKGIRPELCPAIRAFDSLGWIISTPVSIRFQGPRRFSVERFRDVDGNIFLSPGVIGTPDSDRFYARVDTGFSIVESHVPLLAVRLQDAQFPFPSIRMPGTVYPSGYIGPILLAMSSDASVVVPAGNPMLHIIPQSTESMDLQVEVRDINHPGFEGLYSHQWSSTHTIVDTIMSDDLLNAASGA